MEKYIELGILAVMGAIITLYYVINIFDLTYMQIIKSDCTRISHPKKKIFVLMGLAECLYILIGLLVSEKYLTFFIILLVWNLIWSICSSCRLGTDVKLYRFYVIMSFIINLFITSIISLWLGKSLV